MRGPVAKAALIAAVQQEMRGEGYVGDVSSALKHDLDALKDEYDCRIVFQRSTKCYVLQDLGELALLDLPDTCMEALAFLEASFPEGAAIPEHAYIRALLDRITLLLPSARQQQHRGRRGGVSLQLAESSADRIDASVLKTVKRARSLQQELEFDYRSNQEDGAIFRHRVAPYEVFFRPEGHGYLDATLLQVTPRDPAAIIPAAIHYRLDRMVAGSLKILPNKLPAYRIQPATYTVRYWLHPNVARRRDIAAHFPNTQIAYHDDGSAIVTASATNLWQARQTLLRYGSACKVLEPPELFELFRKAIREMAQLYELEIV